MPVVRSARAGLREEGSPKRPWPPEISGWPLLVLSQGAVSSDRLPGETAVYGDVMPVSSMTPASVSVPTGMLNGSGSEE